MKAFRELVMEGLIGGRPGQVKYPWGLAYDSLRDRVIVLEKGRLGFDGGVEEGIKYLHYDEGEDGDDDEGLGDD